MIWNFYVSALKDLEFFVPPLRSLETLHNQLSWKQVDEFLERITTLKTPIPSPPKTPKLQYLSRENSQMSGNSWILVEETFSESFSKRPRLRQPP